MNKNYLILIIAIMSLLFSQSEYQILDIPKNSLQVSANNGLYNTSRIFMKPNYKYEFSIIKYPADIGLYNIQYNNLSFSILDYGQFNDNLNNSIINTFYSHELLLDYFILKEVKNIGIFGLSIGGFYSQIEKYKSYGLCMNFGYKKEFNKLITSISIENFGIIFSDYTYYKLRLPLKYRGSFIYNFMNINLGYDLIYSKINKDYQHILNIGINLNKNIKLQFSNSNYNSNMAINSYDYNFLSGLGVGTNINLDKINLGCSVLNLGASGLLYSITFKYNSI